jgi:hypothetical protein
MPKNKGNKMEAKAQKTTFSPTKTIVVTPRQLAFELANVSHGMAPIGAETRTNPRMRKTDKKSGLTNPYWACKDSVIKVTKLNGFANFNYESGVNRRREKDGNEPNFEAQGNYFIVICTPEGHLTPLAIHKEDAAKIVGWKHKADRLTDSLTNPFTTEHLNKTDDSTRFYLRISIQNAKSDFYLSGEAIPYTTLKPFLYTSDYGKYQGLSEENELPINLYGIDKILHMNIDKRSYTIRIE